MTRSRPRCDADECSLEFSLTHHANGALAEREGRMENPDAAAIKSIWIW
jgi:hypothetical protein